MDEQPQPYIVGPPTARPNARRKPRRWLWLLVLVPVLIVGLGFLAFAMLAARFSRYAALADALPAEMAAARRDGLPLGPADLRPNPPVPPSQNAAPLYRQITSLVKARAREEGDAYSNYLKGPRDSATTSRVKVLLAEWAEPLRLSELAAKRPHCDFKRPWEQGPAVMFPEFAAMRGVARALAARAIIENAEGHPLQALETVRTIACISRHAGEDPIVIGMLVQIALQSIGERPFDEVVCTHLDDPAVATKARSVLREFDPPADLEYSLRGEVVVCRVSMGIVRNQPNELERFVGYKPPNGGIRREMTDAWEANMLRYWRRAFSALRETEHDGLARSRRLKALGAEWESHEKEPGYEMSAILMPIYANAQDKALGEAARKNLREGLLRIADFHRRFHRFPTASESVPLLPQDPFANAPMKYRPTSDGFALYSIGENLRDDGGNDRPAKKGDPAPDIVIRVPITPPEGAAGAR